MIARCHLCFIAAFGWLLLAGCAKGSPPLHADEGSAQIAMDLTGPRPTVQLKIGSLPPATAIFDTGAAASILKTDYARALHLPDEGAAHAAGPGGAPVDGFRTTIKGQLGSARFGPAMAVALDIPLPLPGVSAVISPSVFEGRLVRLDFQKSVAQILPKNAGTIPPAPAQPYSGGGLHVMTVTRIPTASLTLPGGRKLVLDVDTGWQGGLELPLSMARELPLLSPPVPGPALRMIGSSTPTFTARLKGFAYLGPVALANPEISFVAGDAAHAKVGMRILRQTVLVLDPEEHRAWVLAK
jgi:hypothetical protein